MSHDLTPDRSPKEIAARWGCSERHVRDLIQAGRLRARRFGSILRVRQADLDEYERAAMIVADAPGGDHAPTAQPPRTPAPAIVSPSLAELRRVRRKARKSAAHPVQELRDRNTIRMVADYWGCSTATVYRRIEDGALSCLRFGSVVRITREQVEEYERRSTTSLAKTVAPSAPAPIAAPAFRPPWARDPFQLGREAGGRLSRETPDRKAADGINLMRHPEVAEALVLWPTKYPRWLTEEQKDLIRHACSRHLISLRSLAIPRGSGGAGRNTPEFRDALEKLKTMVEAALGNS